MPNLESMWTKWFDLYDQLRCDPKFKDQIAPPFLSVPAADVRSILYVGKATAKDGCWGELPHGSTKARIQQARKCTEKFLDSLNSAAKAPGYSSAFWDLAKRLNARAAGEWKSEVKHRLQHIIWSNICKIGASEGNPRGSLRKKQEHLAVETLRLEIELYKPRLVWFVTGDYADDVVGRVSGDLNCISWDKTEAKEGIWWRWAAGGLPVFLWTYHPQGKSRDQVERWLRKASELLPD